MCCRLTLPIATFAPFIRRSTNWLTIIEASIIGRGGRVEVSNPVAAVNNVGGPGKSTYGEILTRKGCPDDSASDMGIWLTIDGPAAYKLVAEVKEDKSKAADKIIAAPGVVIPRKTVASTNKLRLDTFSINTSSSERREVEGNCFSS